MAKRYADDGRRIYYIHSSHMDREWYVPQEKTRMFFAQIIDRVLALMEEDANYCFHLDGQTSVLAEYLELHKEKRAMITRFLQEKRLIIGPWYVQPDETIPFGESMVRNLLLGTETARDMGAECMRVGYIPDAFGHPGSVPMILNGFGLDNVFLSRGPQSELGRDFIWRSADGSEVTVIRVSYGMGSVLDFKDMRKGIRPVEESQQALKMLSEQIHAQKDRPFVLFTCCGDMAMPIEPAETGFDQYDRLEDCFDALTSDYGKLPIWEGELRKSEDLLFLRDTLAQRIYIKTENARVQALLAGIAEPLAVYTQRFSSNTYQPFLSRAWQLLVQNHTHDGICACSANATCRDMMTRYRNCAEICEQVIAFAAKENMAQMDTSWVKEGEQVIAIFNPHPRPYSGAVPFSISLPYELEGEELQAVGADGRIGWVSIQNRRKTGMILSDLEAVQRFVEGEILEGVMQVEELAPACITVFALKKVKKRKETLLTSPVSAENAMISLRLYENGTLELKDKRNNRTYKDLGYLTDVGTWGDAYQFKAVEGDREQDSRSLAWSIAVEQDNADCAVFSLSAVWQLPEGMAMEGKCRSDHLCDVKIVTTVTLLRNTPIVGIRTQIENTARDHKMDVNFPIPMCGDIQSDVAYATELRPADGEPYPTASYVKAGDLAVLHKGIHRYAADGNRLSLTLLLTSNVLYRSFFKGMDETFSEGQLQMPLTLEYALLPLNGESVQDTADGFVCPPAVFLTDRHEGNRKTQTPFVRAEKLRLCTVKFAEDRKGIIFRFSNPGREMVSECIRFDRRYCIRRVRLDETPIDAVQSVSDHMEISAKAGELITLRIDEIEN